MSDKYLAFTLARRLLLPYDTVLHLHGFHSGIVGVMTMTTMLALGVRCLWSASAFIANDVVCLSIYIVLSARNYPAGHINPLSH